MNHLSLRLDEEKIKTMQVNTPHVSSQSPQRILSYHHYNGLVAPSAPQFVDSMGHTTPDSASISSMSMTPDPFSPFQRFGNTFTPHHQFGHNDAVYTPSYGFTPTTVLTQGLSDANGGIHCSPAKQSGSEGRMERPQKAASNPQDLQVPVELLVAKTLGARSQDASIAMQQQLKAGTPARKTAIVEALTPYVLRLSNDKHGNFLIQRACRYTLVLVLNFLLC